MADRRRRLSVTATGVTIDATACTVDEDRGLISSLGERNALDMLRSLDESPGAAAGRRRASLHGSAPDPTKVASFTDKQKEVIGDTIDGFRISLGVTCRKGHKPESPNQDSWFALQLEDDVSIYGVLDGHGAAGHDISNFAKENLPKLVIRDQRFANGRTDLPAVCKDAFIKMQSLIWTADQTKQLSAQFSGTTATIVIHDHKANTLTVAHVGDCTAAVGKRAAGSRRELKGFSVTRDHKPNLPDERARIEGAGGRVIFDGYVNHRVYAAGGMYPGMNMSRALGDLKGHQEAGVSAEPEVASLTVTAEDHVLMVCSDGVWEFIDPQEAANIVARHGGNTQAAADALAKEAWDRWIKEEGGEVVDDITVLLIYLDKDADGERVAAAAAAPSRVVHEADPGGLTPPAEVNSPGRVLPAWCCSGAAA